jgi:beta-glucosidase
LVKSLVLPITEGHAKAIMTSYNLLNGVYTANSYDLCTKVLRNEWGFDGVVMTDWYSSNRGKADNAFCMHAGNDLIMPGGDYYKKSILSGLVCGKTSEEELRRCCANVVKAVMDSAIQKEYLCKEAE